MSQRKPDLDLWNCEECTETFAVLGEFGRPNFCPNCGSEHVREADVPNRPDRPFDPYPPIWMRDEDIFQF